MITENDVTRVAHLARIRLTDDETRHFTEQLKSILGVMHSLQAIPTDGVEPTTSVSGAVMPMRDDRGSMVNAREDILMNARSHYGCYVVPKVIDE